MARKVLDGTQITDQDIPAQFLADRANVAEQKTTAIAKVGAQELLSIALQNNAAIDVIERITALMQEERAYQANVSFDEALNRCQAKISRISADAENKQTNSRYATYARLDREIRPIYTAEGFALSFGEKDCPTAGKTRFVAYLSRGGVTREYIKDMTASTLGPKGAPVMTQVHAEGAVDSYAKRYLVKDIFNIAIGEDDSDGNTECKMGDRALEDWKLYIRESGDLEQLQTRFYEAYGKARINDDRLAMRELSKVKDDKKKEFANARR